MNPNQKNNAGVDKFNEDIEELGQYGYTGTRLSCLFANGNITRAIHNAYPFNGKRVLDMGCGDGVFTFEFLNLAGGGGE